MAERGRFKAPNISYTICVTVVCIVAIAPSLIAGTPQAFQGDRFLKSIVRIENPEGRKGTGFVLRDSIAGFFLVTNKHVVRSCATAGYFDSVFVRKNMLGSSGRLEVSSVRAKLLLSMNGNRIFFEHPDTAVDLVAIPIGVFRLSDSNTIMNPSDLYWLESAMGLGTEVLATRDQLSSSMFLAGTPVQITGFSLEVLGAEQLHVSRFGHIAVSPGQSYRVVFRDGCPGAKPFAIKAEWIVLDIVSRGGDSGAPVLDKERNLVLGFVKGNHVDSEICYAQSSGYVWDMVKILRNHLRNQ